MMKTLLTYNLMLFFVLRFSNKSKGARLGTNNREMLDSKMIFPIVSQTLVELSVFILRDIIRISCLCLQLYSLLQFHPNLQSLAYHQKLLHLLPSLVPLLFASSFILFFSFIQIFNLWLIIRSFFTFFLLWFLFLIFIITDFLFPLFLNMKRDWISNELAVLLYNLLDSLFFQKLFLVILHMKNDFSTTSD